VIKGKGKIYSAVWGNRARIFARGRCGPIVALDFLAYAQLRRTALYRVSGEDIARVVFTDG
jgi:hypothetical protein